MGQRTNLLLQIEGSLPKNTCGTSPNTKAKNDDIFANAFDAITILSRTQHIVHQKDTEQ